MTNAVGNSGTVSRSEGPVSAGRWGPSAGYLGRVRVPAAEHGHRGRAYPHGEPWCREAVLASIVSESERWLTSDPTRRSGTDSLAESQRANGFRIGVDCGSSTMNRMPFEPVDGKRDALG